jgi:2,5-dihydroxypyridine 5,6-dioxygenase
LEHGSEAVQGWARADRNNPHEPHQPPADPATAVLAANALGAIVNRLDLRAMNAERSLSRDKLAYVGKTPLSGNAAAIPALKASDIVIDLMVLLFSPEQIEIMESGTRILLAAEPPEVLVRMVPSLEDRARVLKASEMLKTAKTMTVTSTAGTDFRCALGEYPLLIEYGFVDEPGRWDHWPRGFLATWSNEGSSEGTIVLAV